MAALIGLVIGFLIVFLIWLPAAASTNLLVWLGMVWGQASIPWPLMVWAAYPLAWPWYAVIGTVSTVMMALLADFLGMGHGPSTNRGTKPGLDKPG
jgi:hypothetical protein